MTSVIIVLFAAAGHAERPAGIATGGGGSFPLGTVVVVVGAVVVVVVGAVVVVATVVVVGWLVVVVGWVVVVGCVVVVFGGGAGRVVVVVVVVATRALSRRPDPGSSVCVAFGVMHMRALIVWPTLIVLRAHPKTRLAS